MPKSCFQYFLLPCYCVLPSLSVIPSSILHSDKTPTSFSCVHFPLTRLDFRFPLFSFSLPCMLSSSLSWSLLQIFNQYLFFSFSSFLYVEYVCDVCRVQLVTVTSKYCRQCFNSLCCSSLTTEPKGLSAMPPPCPSFPTLLQISDDELPFCK